MFVIEYFLKGGVVIYPIVGVAIVAFTLIYQRYRALKQQITAINRADTPGTALHHLREVGQQTISFGRAAYEDRLKQVIYEEVTGITHQLSTIQILGNLLPMLGLLGTITGMISVFVAISGAGVGDPQVVASGISEALITTQAGLTFAIPVLFLHNHLSEMANRVIIELKRTATSLSAQLPTHTPHV